MPVNVPPGGKSKRVNREVNQRRLVMLDWKRLQRERGVTFFVLSILCDEFPLIVARQTFSTIALRLRKLTSKASHSREGSTSTDYVSVNYS